MKLSSFAAMLLLLLLLPQWAMASEPCGPGLGALLFMGLLAFATLIGFIALILLFGQPRWQKGFYFTLCLNLILHVFILAAWYFDCPSGNRRPLVFFRLLFEQDNDNELLYWIARIVLAF